MRNIEVFIIMEENKKHIIKQHPLSEGEPIRGEAKISGLSPFGLGRTKPHHFVEMMGVAWLLALQAFLRSSTPPAPCAHTHATPMMKAAPMMPTAGRPRVRLARSGGRETCLKGMCAFGTQGLLPPPEVRASGCRYAWGLPNRSRPRACIGVTREATLTGVVRERHS